MENYAFKKGIDQVKVKDIDEVRRKLKAVFGVKTNQGLRYRIKGEYSLRVHEKDQVEKIFADVGVTEIWGTE